MSQIQIRYYKLPKGENERVRRIAFELADREYETRAYSGRLAIRVFRQLRNERKKVIVGTNKRKN